MKRAASPFRPLSVFRGTRIGETVRATAKLVKVEGRRLTFEVEARNEREKVGEGTHRRVVVKRARLGQGQ